MPRGIRLAEFLDWDTLSRDTALAWQSREARKCRCGQVPSEWRKYDELGRPVLEDGVHVEDPSNTPAHVEGEFCPACYELDRAGKAAPKIDKQVNPGWVLRFVPNPGYVAPWEKAAGLQGADGNKHHEGDEPGDD